MRGWRRHKEAASSTPEYSFLSEDVKLLGSYTMQSGPEIARQKFIAVTESPSSWCHVLLLPSVGPAAHHGPWALFITKLRVFNRIPAAADSGHQKIASPHPLFSEHLILPPSSFSSDKVASSFPPHFLSSSPQHEKTEQSLMRDFAMAVIISPANQYN